MTHDTLKPINTNELRDYADRISNPYSQLILDAASELDATRTERNILRAALTPPAAVEDGELRRLMAEATPGPWEFVDMTTTQDWAGDPSYQIKLGQYCIEDTRYYPVAPDFKDAAIIVAAVNALPGLMAERDRMREALESIAGKNDLSGVADDLLEAAARSALYACELIARAALGEQP